MNAFQPFLITNSYYVDEDYTGDPFVVVIVKDSFVVDLKQGMDRIIVDAVNESLRTYTR